MRDTLGVGTCSFSRFSHSHFPDLSLHGLHNGAKSVARALSFARGGGDIKGGERTPRWRCGGPVQELVKGTCHSRLLPAKVFLGRSSCSEGISSLLCIPRLAVYSISVRSFYPECLSAQLAPPDRFGRASRGLLGTPGPVGYCFVGLRHLGSGFPGGRTAIRRRHGSFSHITPPGCPQCVCTAFPQMQRAAQEEVSSHTERVWHTALGALFAVAPRHPGDGHWRDSRILSAAHRSWRKAVTELYPGLLRFLAKAALRSGSNACKEARWVSYGPAFPLISLEG